MSETILSLVEHIRPLLPLRLQQTARKLRLLWTGFSLLLATLVGYVPSHHTRRFMYSRVFGVQIGRGTIIHWQTRFFHPSGIRIGNYSNIGNNAFLDGRRGIEIGDYVATGAEIMIYSLQHDIDSQNFAAIGDRVVIDDYAYLGPRTIILPGVHIGEGAVVAAGAVVTSDVAPFTVVGGVPAKFIRYRPKELHYRPDFAMPFQ